MQAYITIKTIKKKNNKGKNASGYKKLLASEILHHSKYEL
jgi:hypothetical protein